MSNHPHQVDKTLLVIVIALILSGFLIFSSAALGLLVRDGASISSVAFSQLVFGLIGGSIAMFITSQIHYRWWRQFSLYIFLFTMFLTLLVFVPGIGMEHGGATRWLVIGGFSLQPSELLKVGYVIYVAALFSGLYKKISNHWYGAVPFVGITGIIGITLLLQPDTDSLVLMGIAGMAMYFTAGCRWRDIAIIVAVGIITLTTLAFSRPYVMDRLTTFFDPTTDPLGSSYQIQQSLIAIGSGGYFGRGFGQSVQKFEFLPEPIGDSIFAVFGEEFGFLGSLVLIILLACFTFRGYRIATHASDVFGMLLVVGIMTLIVTQAFLNIAAMTALAPLMGLPLPFISHGGTALLTTLASVGIVLNVSKFQKHRI